MLKFGLFVAFSLAAVSGVEPAYAQNANEVTRDGEDRRGVSVTQRPRPELDPQGIRRKSVLIFPKLEIKESYNDNIYSSDTNEEGDLITEVAPSLRVRSDWNQHEIGLFAEGKLLRYADNRDEDHEDYTVRLNGLADVSRQSTLTGKVERSLLHEGRGEPNAASSVSPTEYSKTIVGTEFKHEFNRANVLVSGNWVDFDFDDDRNTTGGVINNDDRDREQVIASLRIGYEIQPQYEIFLRGNYTQEDYESNLDDTGFNRDSDGYTVDAGVKFDLSGVTFGNVFAGYRERDYDDARLVAVSGLNYGAGVTWNVTTLSSARFDVAQRIEETTTANSSGYTATRVAAKLDHEILRNVLAGADVAYTLNDYEGITRQDDNYAGGLYGKYMINRNIHTTLSYRHSQRDSTVAGSDFSQNVLSLRLEFQM